MVFGDGRETRDHTNVADTVSAAPTTAETTDRRLQRRRLRTGRPSYRLPSMSGLARRTLANLLTWAWSRAHKAVYSVQGDVWVFVGLALLLATIVQELKIGSPWLPPLLMALGALGTVVSVGRKIAQFLRKRADGEFAKLGPAFPADPSVVDPELERRMATEVGSILFSPSLRWRILEAAWTQCVKVVPLHLDLLADVDDPWTSRRQLIAELTPDADMDGTSSLPLEFAFRCLIDACKHDPHILSELQRAQTRGAALR